MAHPQVGHSVPPKLSFAKIAAMPAPNVTPALPNSVRDSKNRSTGNTSQSARANGQVVLVQDVQGGLKNKPKDQLADVTTSINNFSLSKTNMSESHTPSGGGSADSVADDQSQLSSSSLKQHSFDTKSMASVTTFAMDEKESIRPDDSASVRAVEEDEIHPGLSRNSSFQQEVEAPPSLSNTNIRMLSPNVTITARRYPYTTLTNPPRFGDLPIGPVPEVVPSETLPITESSSLADESRPRSILPTGAPDEKLLEALSSLKDRLPLLQLEEKITSFISNGRDTVLELPPQNSFTRLLTHKLADYYNLAHHINDENNSVRIFRTEFCALPIPLAEIAKSVPVGTQHISHATQVKIMRRVQLGPRQFSAGNSTAASSSVPSKATSENGMETASEEGLQSPVEGTPNKDRSKLTREEREAQYKAARDRIFGNFPESDVNEGAPETAVSMSRSSSSSGKKKSRKHKTPRDDTFEARSSFVPSYTLMQTQPTYQNVYNEVQYPSGYGPGNFLQSGYNGTPLANFPSYDQNSSYMNQMGYMTSNTTMYGPVDGWQNQQQVPTGNFYGYPNPQGFQQHSVHAPTSSIYMPTSAAPMSMSPSWDQHHGQPPNCPPQQYPNVQSPNQTMPNNASWQGFKGGNLQNAMPYPFGQLSTQNHNSGVPFANQHPVPGSFTGAKSLFNPQTRSFVPSNSSPRGAARGGRKKGQGSASTRTSGTSSPAVSNLSESVPTKFKEDSLQQKYGTLANLPKKPPPTQLSPHFSSDHDTSNPGGPLIVNGNGKSSMS